MEQSSLNDASGKQSPLGNFNASSMEGSFVLKYFTLYISQILFIPEMCFFF